MNAPFLDLIDLAAERLGASVVAANDDFFAPKENLIKSQGAVWIDGKYTDRGKWMDGWETRRRREPGHDWCIVRLGLPGVVAGVDVDTAFFMGNYPEACAIDVCHLADAPSADFAGADWRAVLPRTILEGDAHNIFATAVAPAATHVRLRIFPDGGVARLRVYGHVAPDWSAIARETGNGDIDLAAVAHGGLVIGSSDMFFGSRHNLIMPGDAQNMGDGWETKRRRGPGHDWTIIRLGAAGTVQRLEVDTRHFKGNAPGAFSLDGCLMEEHDADVLKLAQHEGEPWRRLMPQTRLSPDMRHVFQEGVLRIGDVSHIRFNIYPDGGVARLRLYGKLHVG